MIRKAKNEDVNGIMKLLFQVHKVHSDGRPDLFIDGKTKYHPDQVIDIISNDNTPIFVYENEKIICGYAFCIIKEQKEDSMTKIKTLYIDDLCVDEKCRGNHIGKSLLDYVEKYAKDIGCYNVTLNVWSLNESAFIFYKKCGLSIQKIGMEKILK